MAPTVLTSDIRVFGLRLYLASFWLKLPEKEAQKPKTSKVLFYFLFFRFLLFWIILYIDIFPPLRTFNDIVGVKSVFALLTWILITTGKSFFQMPQTQRHVDTDSH